MSDKPPTRSGFCNPSWRTDVEWGAASHARCRKENCPCTCELGEHHSAHGPFKPREDAAEVPAVVPPVLLEERLPKDTMIVAPAGMSFEDMVLGLANNDPRVAAIKLAPS